jgi:hypothetical protein
MALTKSFEITQDGKWLSFLGFDLKGEAKPYRLQIKTAEEASQLAEGIRAEVDVMKGE